MGPFSIHQQAETLLDGETRRFCSLHLEVTHAGVCRCVMCNIWKIPRSLPDLSPEDWVSLLSDDLLSDLRELDITGGEPFLRDDVLLEPILMDIGVRPNLPRNGEQPR